MGGKSGRALLFKRPDLLCRREDKGSGERIRGERIRGQECSVENRRTSIQALSYYEI
jgi:hypothetical protein